MQWRRKWQPTPVFLPGEFQGWGRTESDTAEATAVVDVYIRLTFANKLTQRVRSEKQGT